MGIKERKEIHREDLKQNILDAARELFLKDGYEATSIRKIAAKIEFSPTTIYLYYKDKSDIMHALHEEGFHILIKSFEVLQTVEHPFERLKAMGRLYIQFALENTDLYELMFLMKEPIEYLDVHCKDEEWEEGTEAFDWLCNTIKECMDAGYFTKFEVKTFSMMVWATMHGLCTMKITGHMEHIAKNKHILPDAQTILEFSFHSFISVLESLKA